jgi:hypothetical protein
MEPARQHPRFAHAAAIAVRVDGVVHRGHTINLSKGGLCADMPASIAIGTDVVVELQLVFDREFRTEPLQLEAKVVWCTSVDDNRQIGLSFQRLSTGQKQFLSLFLRFLDHSTREPVFQPRGLSVDERFC